MTAQFDSPRAAGPAEAPVESHRDIVFTFSYETYNDAVIRGMGRPPDRILSTLLTTPAVRRVLVANPFRSVATENARRLLRLESEFPTSELHTLHRPLRVRRSDPTDLAGIERTYLAYSRSLRRAAHRRTMVRPEVITVNPLVAGFGDFSWAAGVTYFGRDDWASSTAHEAYWPAYREAYDRIARNGIAVTAVSQPIIDRIGPTGPNAVVPNGVEETEWLGPSPAPPAWFAGIPSPRAVYVGTLDTRLDLEGIADLATRKPYLSIVLVGPATDPSYLDPVRGFSNVHVHGGVRRPEIVAVLRNAELSLLAHRRTPLTEAMSPLKVYEYLAAGCAVISIDLPPMHGLGDRVTIVKTVADFADVLDEALARGRQDDESRRAWVRSNSWRSRHAAILQLSEAQKLRGFT